MRGGEGAVGIAVKVPRYIMIGEGRHGQNDINKQHVTTFRRETCAHRDETVAIVWPQQLYVLLYMYVHMLMSHLTTFHCCHNHLPHPNTD